MLMLDFQSKKGKRDDSHGIMGNDMNTYIIWGARWLAHLPHTSRVGGSIPAVCVEFACSPCASGVSSEYSGFLPRSKDMHCRLIGISKLSVVCDCVSE
ncbi:hypothetical protein QTP86_024326 [Hemibagrus guttatus]|nr:hypothetical protein QTP86_024326 [Hemibagrus guttatus]